MIPVILNPMMENTRSWFHSYYRTSGYLNRRIRDHASLSHIQIAPWPPKAPGPLANSSQQLKKPRHPRWLAVHVCPAAPAEVLNRSNHKASKCHYLNLVILHLNQVGLMAAPTLDHEPALPRIRYHTSRVMATTPSSPCLCPSPMDTTNGTRQRTMQTSCPPANNRSQEQSKYITYNFPVIFWQ